MKNVLRRFKQVEEGSIKKGAIGFHKVLKGSTRFKEVQKGSRRFKKVQECLRRLNNRNEFKKVLDIKEERIPKGLIVN